MTQPITATTTKRLQKTTWFLIAITLLLLALGSTTGILPLTVLGIICLIAALVDYFIKLPGIWEKIRKVVVLATGIVGVLVIVAAIAASLKLMPAKPDAFYTPPKEVPSSPGVLIRSEPLAREVPPGMRGWRILYTTTRQDGTPAVASGVVLAPLDTSAGPRPVITWTHGTTGSDPACAPSLLPDPYPFDPTIPALDQVAKRGWNFVATDYVGLGTKGPHPYLIGEGQARSALDATRAAKQLPDVQMEDRTVVWGHSQGGNAALWTGILAPSYASDVNVIGVAALAPAADVAALVEGVKDTEVGKIITAIFLRAYSEAYPDVRFNQLVRLQARWITRDVGKRCLAAPSALASIIEVTKLLQGPIWAASPSQDPALAQRMAENTPRRPIQAPLLIAQGLTDELALPNVQKAFVEERCAAGQSLEYRTYAGKDHVGVVGSDSLLNQDIIDWTEKRLANEPQVAGCSTVSR
jgi:alpha-beta hydrolase superfamily lysophospholipase